MVGATYHWFLKVDCRALSPSAGGFGNNLFETDLVVEGYLQRQSFAALSETVSPIAQAQHFAKAGVWQDALTVLLEAQLSSASRGDGDVDGDARLAIATAIEQLLTSVGLDPFVPYIIQD